MIYFCSDHHFYHKNIIKYSGRPFQSVEEMNSTLIKRHNSLVTDEDTVYFLGDFAFASIEKQAAILSALKGKKHLFLGNHDRNKRAMLSIGFLTVHNIADLEIEGHKFRVNHYPFAPHDSSEDVRYLDRRPKREDCSWLLCGHIHERWCVRENQINVGVDVWDFYPVPFEKILEIVQKKGVR